MCSKICLRSCPFQVCKINTLTHKCCEQLKKLFLATSLVVAPFRYWQYCLLHFIPASVNKNNKVKVMYLGQFTTFNLRMYATFTTSIYVPDDRYTASCLLFALKNIISRGYRGCLTFFGISRGKGGYCILANIRTSRRFKCVPQILGSLSIHIFTLLFLLITYS